jgi:hypothetical protein
VRGLDVWKFSFLAAGVALAFMTWQFLAVRSHFHELATRVAGAPQAAIVSILLTPDVRRGNAPASPGAPNAVQISADTSTILLHLQLEPTDGFMTYNVVISNVDSGRQVWGQTGLRTSGDGAQIVTTELPAHVLPPGDYTVLLQTPERPSDPVVQGYSLRIPRK